MNTTSTGTPDSPLSLTTYEQKIALTVVTAVFGVWSTVGNVITILAITTRPYMRTKTNVFILSLAMSDLLSGVVASPLWLYRKTWGFDPWEWGSIACKLYWCADETTSYCTAMHIASFAIWRFILVRWPHRSNTKIRTICIWVIIMWIIASIFGGFVFSLFVSSQKKPPGGEIHSGWPMCAPDPYRVEEFTTYYTFSSTTFILCPMVILFVMSGLIANELFFNIKFKSELTKIKERKAARQLVLIATFFLIGYVPMISCLNWTIRTKKDTEHLIRVNFWYTTGYYLSLRASECFNPIVYNIASQKMRRASKEILSYVWYCCGARKRTLIFISTSRRCKSPQETKSNRPTISKRISNIKQPGKSPPNEQGEAMKHETSPLKYCQGDF